jgi:hypothetical protein
MQEAFMSRTHAIVVSALLAFSGAALAQSPSMTGAAAESTLPGNAAMPGAAKARTTTPPTGATSAEQKSYYESRSNTARSPTELNTGAAPK